MSSRKKNASRINKMSTHSLPRQNIHVLTTSIIGMSSLNSEGIAVETHVASGVSSCVTCLSNSRLLGNFHTTSHISVSLGRSSYYTSFVIHTKWYAH